MHSSVLIPSRRPLRPLARLALGAAVLGVAVPAQAQDRRDNNCARTAIAAREASRLEIQADLLNAIGVCLNQPSFFEAIQCSLEAFEEYQEALHELPEQYQARLDLCEALGSGPYAPHIDPDEFSSSVDNPFFPLVVGTTLVYEGETEDGLERVECKTLDETREIMGVECAVVQAREFVDGEMVEDTLDYYAQDLWGNVWYFGELSFELEDGFIVNMDGSWIAGEDGAKPGIIMLASADPGRVYRQEWYLNEAEDIGTFIAEGQSVEVPFNGGTTFEGCWQIQDTTPIEPDELEYKYFAMGVGLVKALDVESGEEIELVDILVE